MLSQWTEEDIPESELVYTKPKELPCFNSTIIEETNPIFQPVTAVPVTAELPKDDAIIVELGTKKNNLPEPVSKEVITQEIENITSENREVVTQNTAGNFQDVVMLEQEGHVASHGEFPKSGQFLPVEGGYIFVDDTQGVPGELQSICYSIL